MPDIGVELVIPKIAVDELRARKGREHWHNTVSFQKTKKNYAGNIYTMIGVVLLHVIFVSPIISIFDKSLISTEISLFGPTCSASS
ncbi:MAG: hypothetical protein QXL94_05830 [Candidatus Parvarchaeum sp.]